MTDEQRFNQFIQRVKETKVVWLLQANDGLFAMLEGDAGNTYIPVWSNENACIGNASDLWQDYVAASMSVTEMLNWCDELQHDEISIGVEPQNDGRILPLAPEIFKNIFSNL